MLAEDEAKALRERCTRWLGGHGPETAGQMLASIPADTVIDRYGAGGVVSDLETEIRQLLGKDAAVFVPSGTMAQQIVLRVHADRRGRSTVLYHPMCHLRHHEGQALERVQRLIGRPVGDSTRVLTFDDLRAVAEPPAALLIELPQRDLGGQQPSLDDLKTQLGWARDRGAATHLDGARLWESAAGYGCPPSDVAAGFDTVYVSFYKGVGALAGCCIAGPTDIVDEVREWRRRMGGTLFGLWPNAASALALLRQRLPKMPYYLEHARAIAGALSELPNVTVVPDPPQTPMMHLLMRTTADAIDDGVRRLAQDEGLWALRTTPTDDPTVQRAELSVGDATLQLTATQVAEIVAELVRP